MMAPVAAQSEAPTVAQARLEANAAINALAAARAQVGAVRQQLSADGRNQVNVAKASEKKCKHAAVDALRRERQLTSASAKEAKSAAKTQRAEERKAKQETLRAAADAMQSAKRSALSQCVRDVDDSRAAIQSARGAAKDARDAAKRARTDHTAASQLYAANPACADSIAKLAAAKLKSMTTKAELKKAAGHVVHQQQVGTDVANKLKAARGRQL
jgi:hypothetical protein